jgi:hypothetical protein
LTSIQSKFDRKPTTFCERAVPEKTVSCFPMATIFAEHKTIVTSPETFPRSQKAFISISTAGASICSQWRLYILETATKDLSCTFRNHVHSCLGQLGLEGLISGTHEILQGLG